MPRIKRVKHGPATFPALPPAVHYATAVAAAGNVTGWTDDPARALDVSAETAALVLAHYAGRPNTGTVTVESETPEPELVEPAGVAVKKPEQRPGRKSRRETDTEES